MTMKKLFAVRAKPEVHALFTSLHEELQQQLPYGGVTRSELLEIIVNSASADMRKGRFPIPTKDEKAA